MRLPLLLEDARVLLDYGAAATAADDVPRPVEDPLLTDTYITTVAVQYARLVAQFAKLSKIRLRVEALYYGFALNLMIASAHV